MPGDPALTTGDASQPEPSQSSHLYAVALKLPTFWPDSCESWFINAESQFHLKNITSSVTKFHHVITSLLQNEIDNVVDLIRNPSATDPYRILRAHLLQTHSLTDYARCESIMSLPLSGDMLPSALLSRMRALLPIKHQDCLFLRHAFLKQLPADVRSAIDISILAQRTDEIYRSSLSSNSAVNAVDSVHAVNAHPSRQNRRFQRSEEFLVQFPANHRLQQLPPAVPLPRLPAGITLGSDPRL